MNTTHTVKMTKSGAVKVFKMVMGVAGGKVNGKWRSKDEVLDEMHRLTREGWTVVAK